jgi:glycosyltransferase involved in cell wall biosynthesis
MRVLHCLYYYRPHYSGLTVYTERLAKALAARGHQVTVLTARYDRSLAPEEVLDGVVVRRVPVAMTVSKGPIMPAFQVWGARLARSHDVVHLHVPCVDAAPLAVTASLFRRPVVLTYHCDLSLPRSPLNALANLLSHVADRISVSMASAVVTNTRDYADNSPLLSRHIDRLQVISPPIDIASVEPQTVAAMRVRLGIRPGQHVIGMAARLATEKGAEVLAEALPLVLGRFPDARVLYVGQYREVMGEDQYAEQLRPLLERLGEHWTFLGVLTTQEMAVFYRTCSVTVLPSLNSTESFGMVQVESMACGTPVVASDLPGVRQPTAMTGMGLVVAPRSPAALAEGILQVFENPGRYRGDPEAVAQRFSPGKIAEQYEELYQGMLTRGGR